MTTDPKHTEDEEAAHAGSAEASELLDPERDRLALVEVVPAERDRVYRSPYYPYFQAIARSRGVEVCWLAVYAPERPAPGEGDRYVYELPRATVQKLLGRLGELRPTRVALNERLRDELFEEIRDTCSSAELRYADGLLWKAWFQVIPDGHALPNLVSEPDYRREVLDPELWATRPYTHVVLGPECVYKRPVAKNPLFAGVDLSGCENVDGCSFCSRPAPKPGDEALSEPVEEIALRHVLAAERSSPPGYAREFLFHGGEIWFRAHRFFAGVLDASLPPSAFHFHCRLDEIRRMAERVEPLLPRLAEAGHSVCFSNVGLESFAPEENRRFNKGLTPELIKEATVLLHGWEQRFPETVRFGEHGGFGFITFSPWTTREDLRHTVEGLRWLAELYPIPTLAFCSQLQLLPGRAVTELARRDGLVVESPGAWTFDAGCITCSDVEEIPWRFRHPEVGRVCAIAQRLVVDDKLPKPDDLARHVRARLTGRVPEGHDTLTVFACLVDYVDGHPDEEDVDKIIDGVVELVRRQPLPLEARMADAASRLLRRLGERPPRSLRGFVPEALLHHPGGQGWGEIEAVLVRGDERLHLFMRSRDGFAEAFARTDHVSLSYGDDGPVNTVEKAMVARTMATAVERFLLGRPRDP